MFKTLQWLIVPFLIVLIFGGQKHGIGEAVVVGLIVTVGIFFPMMIVGAFIGEELAAVVWVAVSTLLAINAATQSHWSWSGGSSYSDNDCGRYGNERCY
jgi:L-lactate permease